MAKGFNKVILMGNLTRDPETRTTPSGQSVTSFSLAVNRTWRGQDGTQQESVSYIDCVAWGKPGEIIAQYLGKGRAILVSGRLDQRSWEDKESGQKRSKVEVIVEDFNFVDGRGGEGGGNGGGASSQPKGKASNDDTVINDVDGSINLDEIPF
ncbi:MAG TPA: single-stranded DNA-binding protein [Candidatus Saccharimonadales bacterium]|nr:single-stranded DNA-binding protein [Candidatus Saccharimonadales bacterium]